MTQSAGHVVPKWGTWLEKTDEPAGTTMRGPWLVREVGAHVVMHHGVDVGLHLRWDARQLWVYFGPLVDKPPVKKEDRAWGIARGTDVTNKGKPKTYAKAEAAIGAGFGDFEIEWIGAGS